MNYHAPASLANIETSDVVRVYPMPGQYRDQPFVVMIYPGQSRWRQIADLLAWHFDASPDELDCVDCYFGGEFNDDNSADVLTVRGEIVGSFDRALSADEWCELLANDDNINRGRKP